MTIANELRALAMDFAADAYWTRNTTRNAQLNQAARQLTGCSLLVADGTYDDRVGQAWLDAGRLTLSRLRKVENL